MVNGHTGQLVVADVVAGVVAGVLAVSSGNNDSKRATEIKQRVVNRCQYVFL